LIFTLELITGFAPSTLMHTSSPGPGTVFVLQLEETFQKSRTAPAVQVTHPGAASARAAAAVPTAATAATHTPTVASDLAMCDRHIHPSCCMPSLPEVSAFLSGGSVAELFRAVEGLQRRDLPVAAR
jgi:hypothetical protein